MRTAYIQLTDEKNIETMVKAYAELTHHQGDAGLDVFCTNDLIESTCNATQIIKLGFSMVIVDVDAKSKEVTPISYMLLARSSTHKLGIMQSNNVGIIDAGYRGQLMVPIISTNGVGIDIDPWSRLFQVVVVLKKHECLETRFPSSRSTGGFGSTGG